MTLRLMLCLAGLLSLMLISFGHQMDREAALLLHSERTISGIVMDASGRPVIGASIWHTDKPERDFTTDANGHFSISTRAPAVVIRKPGFNSAFIKNAGTGSVHIALERSHWAPSKCTSRSVCDGIKGFGGIFCFPRIEGVVVSKQDDDIDYGMRLFSLQLDGKFKGIRHGAGPLWGVGIPENELVWRSVDYAETTYLVDKTLTPDYAEALAPDETFRLVLDARGKTADKFWRSIGRFGESADYHDVDRDIATLLDAVMDGVCVRAEKR